MKVTYLKLINVAGLKVGSDRKEIVIDFSKSKNKIISIIAENSKGKTTLLSSISPFAHVTSLDERSGLPYIIQGKSGYKEIHYQDENNIFIIKHYYKPNKDTHSVKSYFSLNGEELNENGNVTSFLSLVEFHFGLTQEMMRLIRLGSNVNSFVSLTPTRRKEYIGKLIEEVNIYSRIHKKISEDIRVTRILMQNNHQNLYNCHITDQIVENQKLDKIEKEIKKNEKERDEFIKRIGKIQSLMKENNIFELRKRKQEAESSLLDLERTEENIKNMHLENISVDELIKRRSNLSDEKISIQSKINSYRLSIDTTLKTIERLELSVKKITSNNDIQSLINAISSLRTSIESTSKLIKNFIPIGSTSSEINELLSLLSSFNHTSQVILSFGNKPIEIYLKLKRDHKSIDKFLKEQARKIQSSLSDSDIKILLDQVFEDEMIISPNCHTEYLDCPYYRLSNSIMNIRDKLTEDHYDSETLRYIQIISNNIDNILNEIDKSRRIKIPDKLRDDLNENTILNRLENKLPFFDLSGLQEYLSILKEWEIYQSNVNQLKEYEHQLSIYKQSGVDTHLQEIQEARKSIDFYKSNISILSKEIEEITHKLSEIDMQIGIVTKYLDGKKYQKVFQSTLDSTIKILIPLENAAEEKTKLDYQLQYLNSTIDQLRLEHKKLETRLNEYDRLMKEGIELDKKYKDLNIILKSVSTRKGIPVIFMKKYLGKIQQLANNLLRIIYDEELQLANFEVDEESFSIPYIKNGTKIPDVKYASQSEVSLITMALSFALANRASDKYNILLLDEIDSGLDEINRSAFLKMLYIQMNALDAEQVFMISQNITQMANVPMDCIILSDIGMIAKLQNVIYE